jgi:hypothetical protein
VGPADYFLSEQGSRTLVEAAASVRKLCEDSKVHTIVAAGLNAAQSRGKDYLVGVVPWEFEHPADSPLLKLALDRKLLETISAYLGMWPRLDAAGAWLNFPTPNESNNAQLWHRYPEDLHLIKVFIYLNYVGTENTRGDCDKAGMKGRNETWRDNANVCSSHLESPNVAATQPESDPGAKKPKRRGAESGRPWLCHPHWHSASPSKGSPQ